MYKRGTLLEDIYQGDCVIYVNEEAKMSVAHQMMLCIFFAGLHCRRIIKGFTDLEQVYDFCITDRNIDTVFVATDECLPQNSESGKSIDARLESACILFRVGYSGNGIGF